MPELVDLGVAEAEVDDTSAMVELPESLLSVLLALALALALPLLVALDDWVAEEEAADDVGKRTPVGSMTIPVSDALEDVALDEDAGALLPEDVV